MNRKADQRMKIYHAALVFGGIVNMTTPAKAHLGHMGELAGHGHLAGVAAIGVAAAIAAALAARKLKKKPEQETAQETSS
jgi:hypothetical protein